MNQRRGGNRLIHLYSSEEALKLPSGVTSHHVTKALECCDSVCL